MEYLVLFCLIFIHGSSLLLLCVRRMIRRMERQAMWERMPEHAEDWYEFQPIKESQGKVDWKTEGF